MVAALALDVATIGADDGDLVAEDVDVRDRRCLFDLVGVVRRVGAVEVRGEVDLRRTRVISTFWVNIPRARVPEQTSSLRNCSER